jgi:hypothetical protein
MMNAKPIIDGGRQRCKDCGHPRREHRRTEQSSVHQCTVPKCACAEYQLPDRG